MSVDVVAGPAVALFLAVAFAAAATEHVVARRRGLPIHDPAELRATLGVWAGHFALRALEATIAAAVFGLVWRHRFATIDASTPFGLLGLFLGFEFLYYWYHRAAHRVRWFWATHSVHHSARRLDLTAAMRLGWTGAVSGHFLFFAPLAAIGYSPQAIAAAAAFDLAWQFFIHTELVPSLGPLEWIFDTPRHHAVHHASNEACLDRNFGGVLIVFDRLFGTFAPMPAEPLRFGLAGRAPTTSVLDIVFGEWRRLFTDLAARPTLGAALRFAFSPPEETPPAALSPRPRTEGASR